jgi:hypothetical protein
MKTYYENCAFYETVEKVELDKIMWHMHFVGCIRLQTDTQSMQYLLEKPC